MNPIRLQLSRKKGFDLQEHSRALNGLEAVNCARPGKWGNPFVVGSIFLGKLVTQELAVSTFKKYLAGDAVFVTNAIAELRGKNLACWCKKGEPCHADVLLEIANKEE